LPVVTTTSLISGAGDLIIILYIFALLLFFFSLSGLDTGNPTARIVASRELTPAVLVEPMLLPGLPEVALMAGSTNIDSIRSVISLGWVSPTATSLSLLA
ncbi:NADH-quinone oxidoreductase subunit H, partial [Morganella morganii]|uniref:NADH-quinone oxidoreductase subunit H n=1 Tax=Morganella morganii TaxID=582 RepID=UPI0015F37ABE